MASAILRVLSALLLLVYVQGIFSDDPEPQLGCPAGWHKYWNECWLIKGGLDGRETAEDLCRAQGAKLAVFRYDSQLDYIKSQLHIKCVDQDPKCPQLASKGDCVRLPTWMKKNCRFSCDFCSSSCGNDVADHDNCIRWAHSGACESRPGFMMAQCKQSCGCDGYSDDYWIDEPTIYGLTVDALEVSPPGGDLKADCYQLHTKTNRVYRVPCSSNSGAGHVCWKRPQPQDIVVADPLHTGCPVHGFGYKSKCYFLDVARTTWQQASAGCQALKGEMASIPNEEVLNFVSAELLVRHTKAWVGLSKGADHRYEWVNGDRVEYLPWGAEHKGNEAYECVRVNNKGQTTEFEAYSCSERHFTVCEIPRVFDIPETETSEQVSEVVLGDCPAPWKLHGEFCYNLFAEKPLSWRAAQEECRNLNGDLASIHNLDAQKFIRERFLYLSPEDYVWIGLYKAGTNEPFAWSDGSAFDYNKWLEGYPLSHNVGEKCIHAEYELDTWSEGPCTSKLRYVCQVWRGELHIETTPAVTTTTTHTTTADVAPVAATTTTPTPIPTTPNPIPTTPTPIPTSTITTPIDAVAAITTSYAPTTTITEPRRGIQVREKAKLTTDGEEPPRSLPPGIVATIVCACAAFVFILSVALVLISRRIARKQPREKAPPDMIKFSRESFNEGDDRPGNDDGDDDDVWGTRVEIFPPSLQGEGFQPMNDNDMPRNNVEAPAFKPSHVYDTPRSLGVAMARMTDIDEEWVEIDEKKDVADGYDTIKKDAALDSPQGVGFENPLYKEGN